MYDSIAVAELTLINTGKVAFEYHALNMDPALQQRPQPGKPILVPHTVSFINITDVIRGMRR